MSSQQYVSVADIDTVRESGRKVVSPAGNSIVLFYHEGAVYAVDNRCPHMGFPLAEGSVADGILTCHWHHARFELACGDTFDIWADDVQTYPTKIEDGEVLVDPDPDPDVPPETYWRNRLVDGLSENISLVMAKAVINLDDLGAGFHQPLETTLEFGVSYRGMGWGRGLTTLGTMANLHGWVESPEKPRAMYVGAREVADNCAGEPPRFDQYALGNESVGRDRLKEWFREHCGVRDENGAERTIRTAAASLPPEETVEILVAAATDHLYLNNSHTLDFINKACETLDHVGWERAPDIFGAVVPQLTGASRAEEGSAWRKPEDIAALVFDAHDSLSDLVAAGEGKKWNQPTGFVDDLLGDDPEAIVERLQTAVREGATAEQLTDAVAQAATRRVAQFATSNEFSDWNTVHHTFSYANAAHELARRTEAIEAYRPAFDGAMSIYLDRFLNQPAARIPTDEPTDRKPKTIQEELLSCFDEHGRVNDAGTLVAEHFEAGGDPEQLIATLGKGLLQEDPQFHTLQNLEGAIRRYERATTEHEQRLPLVAASRYMAAHYPTRREAEQTFDIARRLHRGEQLHE